MLTCMVLLNVSSSVSCVGFASVTSGAMPALLAMLANSQHTTTNSSVSNRYETGRRG